MRKPWSMRCSSVSEDTSEDWIFLSLHRWVARWLLHWSELDFAEDVLRAIPRKLAENDASIQTLWDLLDGVSSGKAWSFRLPVVCPCQGLVVSESAHRAPAEVGGASSSENLRTARFEGMDQENEVAFLVAAKHRQLRAINPFISRRN